MRAGLTLLEMIIALAVFGLVCAMAFEGLLGVRRYGDLQRAQGILELEGARALDRIADELANSAWMPAPPPAANLTTFPRVWKAGDPTRGDPPSFPFGETLTYYKLRTEATIAPGSPLRLRVEHVAFDDFAPANRPVAMSQFAAARPVDSLVLNAGWALPGAGDPPPVVTVVWEAPGELQASSVAAPAVNWQANLDLANLRRYRLTTIPDPATGLAILVRQWQNGGSAVDTDWPPAELAGADANCVELARDVVDLAFDTYLTELDTATTRLNPNQVRVDLVLGHALAAGGAVRLAGGAASDGIGGAAVTRRFSATVSLRSVTDPTE